MSKRFTSERILTSQGILLTFVRTYRHLREYEIVNNHNLKNQLPALWQNQWPFDQPITDGDLTTYYEKLRTHRYANVVAVSSSHHHISVDLPAGVTFYSPVIHRVWNQPRYWHPLCGLVWHSLRWLCHQWKRPVTRPQCGQRASSWWGAGLELLGTVVYCIKKSFRLQFQFLLSSFSTRLDHLQLSSRLVFPESRTQAPHSIQFLGLRFFKYPTYVSAETSR